MKASDYIVNYLVKKGILDFFGFQGTMIAHFVDSVGRHPVAKNHVCINEQGAAFAAVGYAKTSGRCSLAYATSGPGAINMISGIADAYYDSAPVIFITGQLNTNEYTNIPDLRQQGFQQTNVISMVHSITKYCKQITRVEDLPEELEKAFVIATSDRKGPVLLDLPMNIQRMELDADFDHDNCAEDTIKEHFQTIEIVFNELNKAKRPVIILGNGISKDRFRREQIRLIIHKLGIPVITTLLGRDILPVDDCYNMGMIGSAYGHRYANMIAGLKSDLILSLGASLCPRQVGLQSESFAPDAKIIRIDVDPIQLKRRIHMNEMQIHMDTDLFFTEFEKYLGKPGIENVVAEKNREREQWRCICKDIKEKLILADIGRPELRENVLMNQISNYVSNDTVLSVDIGQHQMWATGSFNIKDRQRMITSGGHGAMGFSIPAAIGAYYATGKPVTVLCGDGSAQMNIQELQWIVKDNIPITIIVFNNNMLGLIKQQQDGLFNSRYFGATTRGGYCAPDFSKVAKAYGMASVTIDITEIEKLEKMIIPASEPQLIQILMDEKTGAFPKTVFGEPMYNQKPYVSKELMEELLRL